MSNPSEKSAAPTGTSGYFGSCFSLEKIELQRRLEAAEARIKELELKLVRQDEVAREAYEAAVWKFGQERMELEAKNERLRLASELLLIGYEGLGGDMENNGPREVRAAINS